MTKTMAELERPHARADVELVRGGREGTYWQAADGLVVRLAAVESARDAEAVQRALLKLAIDDAQAQ